MCSTWNAPMPIARYATKIPAMYTPPIASILPLAICIPKRNAIVMRRMENEQGCTLSSRAETPTKGKSHFPPSDTLQMMLDVPGAYLRMTIPASASSTMPPQMSNLRIRLWRHIRLYLKLKLTAFVVDEIDEAVDRPAACGPVRIRVVDNSDRELPASRNDFICPRHGPAVAGHPEGAAARSVFHDKGGRAHARSRERCECDVSVSRIHDLERFLHIAILHRDCAEIVQRL